MDTSLAIVTGGSRGLGLAMAQQLAASGHQVLSLARGRGEGLPETVEQWQADLADPVPVARRLERWLAGFAPERFAGAVLINNAALVSTLAPLAEGDAGELSRAVRVGLEAPLVLTAAFLAATAAWRGPRKVLLISSGLGRRAMAGTTSYCAVKAGMDHLARAVALEGAARPEPARARIVSLAPGVIDTTMQEQLRAADPARFADQARFAALKAGGQLDSPATAAAKVLAYLARPDFGANPVADVRDA